MNPNEETAESQARVESEPEVPTQEPAGDNGQETQDSLDVPQEGPAG